MISRTGLHLLYLVFLTLFCLPPLVGMGETAASHGSLTVEQQATHALNRLGYGPRPGEVAKVAEVGVEKWILRQLDPRKIPDQSAETAIAAFTKLRIPSSDLVAAYQTEIRARRLVQAQQSEMDKAEGTMASAEAGVDANRKPSQERQAARLMVGETLGELMHAKLTRAVMSERQLEEVLVDFWFNHFNVDARKKLVRATISDYEQNVIRPNVWGSFRDLLGATAQSSSMLVYLDNFRSSRAYKPGELEKRMIRRAQADLLGEEVANAAPPPTRGLNENYGRELLELHTLGVEGGYTQKDVQEVARAFTGWTIEQRTGEFIFRQHDDGKKVILGEKFASGGGRRDGEKVLDLLAGHPATAHHLAYKLCQRFVADEPPAELVQRVAQAFLRSQGDLRTTYQALFLDPEFFDPKYYGAKSKSPFEYVASSLRATDAQLTEVVRWPGRLSLHAVEAGAVLGRGGERLAKLKRKTVLLHLVDMGQPLYGWAPPTGFSEDSTTWIGSGALVARLNFALALSAGEVPDAHIDVRHLLGDAQTDDPDGTVDAIAENLLAGGLSDSTRRILLLQGGKGVESNHAVMQPAQVVALLLGSPEFQRR
jgi:uncharacterized protein (DUF1800 family)